MKNKQYVQTFESFKTDLTNRLNESERINETRSWQGGHAMRNAITVQSFDFSTYDQFIDFMCGLTEDDYKLLFWPASPSMWLYNFLRISGAGSALTISKKSEPAFLKQYNLKLSQVVYETDKDATETIYPFWVGTAIGGFKTLGDAPIITIMTRPGKDNIQEALRDENFGNIRVKEYLKNTLSNSAKKAYASTAYYADLKNSNIKFNKFDNSTYKAFRENNSADYKPDIAKLKKIGLIKEPTIASLENYYNRLSKGSKQTLAKFGIIEKNINNFTFVKEKSDDLMSILGLSADTKKDKA